MLQSNARQAALPLHFNLEHSCKGNPHREFLQHPVDCVLCVHDRQLTPLHAAGKKQHLSAVPGVRLVAFQANCSLSGLWQRYLLGLSSSPLLQIFLSCCCVTALCSLQVAFFLQRSQIAVLYAGYKVSHSLHFIRHSLRMSRCVIK